MIFNDGLRGNTYNVSYNNGYYQIMLDDYYFNSLKNKYNYDDNLIDALKKQIPLLINYYGKRYEKRILISIMETPIVFCANDEEAKQITFDGNKLWLDDWEMGYKWTRYKRENPKNGELIDFAVRSIIVVRRSTYEEMTSTLLHELAHLIKTPCRITSIYDKKGILQYKYARTGMSLKFYDEEYNFIGRKYNGWEEASNTFDEYNLLKALNIDFEKANSGYDILLSYFKVIYDTLDHYFQDCGMNFDQLLKNDQLLGTKTIKEVLNEKQLYNRIDWFFEQCNNNRLSIDEEIKEFDKIFDDLLEVLYKEDKKML